MGDDFQNAQALVDATIRKLGIDPATARVSGGATSSSVIAWTLKRGSASVLVTVSRHDDEKATYLRVASPVVNLPADAGVHLALFRRLLEMNGAGLANVAFGLTGDRVVAVSERPAEGLGAEEVEQCIRHLAAVADTFDDRLIKEFGATKA
ncbi:MAG: YbjN domain-containing protein [Polyangiaceae bacterium]